jgi:serine phosphatase RsbU (regulator of sigma subunit)
MCDATAHPVGRMAIGPARAARQGGRRRLTRAAAITLALFVPVLIGSLFPHPTRVSAVPAGLMLLVIVTVSVLGSRLAGVIAAVTSTLALWFFVLPPGETFDVENRQDVFAVVVIFVVGMVAAVALANLQRGNEELRARDAARETELAVQHDTIVALQEALLPPGELEVDGLETAATYIAGAGGNAPVGGDWWVVVPLSKTRIGLGIADVSGHGIDAVAAMAEARFAMRVIARDAATPADALQGLAHTVNEFETGDLTAMYGVIDREHATWSFANAGHLPPVVRHADGRVTVVQGASGPMLSHSLDAVPYETTTMSLRADDILVLFTDGLIERRGEDIVDDGLARLVQMLSNEDCSTPDTIVATLVHKLLDTERRDDVAIVVTRYEPLDT